MADALVFALVAVYVVLVGSVCFRWLMYVRWRRALLRRSWRKPQVVTDDGERIIVARMRAKPRIVMEDDDT